MARAHKTILRTLLIVIVALIVAAVCRSYVFELYTVAPQQMENALVAGDRLIVEKWHYGVRLPQSYISLPHIDTLPGTRMPARLPYTPLPYKRISLRVASHNDILLYNYPIQKDVPLSLYPTAIARCIGVPGDTVEARNGELYINGEPSAQSPVVSEGYLIADSLWTPVEQAMVAQWGKPAERTTLGDTHLVYIDRLAYNKLCAQLPPALHPVAVSLAQDNYTVDLPPYGSDAIVTPDNAAFYAEIINSYEPHKVSLQGNALYHNGRKIERYRFSQPYYWVLCDNRTAATDSRTFGVLPHSHLIGRCGIILFSIDATRYGFDSWRTHRFFQPSR